MSRMTPELRAAYLGTQYCARLAPGDGLELRIGEPNPRLFALMQEHGVPHGCFITAWNPYSEPRGDEENADANRRLEAELRQRGWLVWLGEGRGEDPAWPPEASFLVLGPDQDEAAALCCGYRQHALVAFDSARPPHLLEGDRYGRQRRSFMDARMLAPKIATQQVDGSWSFDWKGFVLTAPTANAMVAALTRALHASRGIACQEVE